MNAATFASKLKQQGIELSDKQKNQFEVYFNTLVEWNQKINLTAITEKDDVYLKHFYDSIAAAFYYDFTKELQLCDVGAGAGFPSIPLKICFPHLQVTIVDSLNKRITFLNQLAVDLELDGVAFYHDRAELFSRNEKFRHSFDVVTARAVARTAVLSELCFPLCKTGGTFIAMKGPNATAELSDARRAIDLLGGEVKEVNTFELPEDVGERNIIIFNKKRKTPNKYPRNPGVPNKAPIQ